MFIVTRNEAVRYNKNKQYDFVPLDEIAHQDGNNLSKSADEDLLSDEIDLLLEQTIRQLPERCRLVFTLIRQENMKYTEVAELLSLKESTVRVQMKIAIEKIAATMKPHFPNLELVVFVLFVLNNIGYGATYGLKLGQEDVERCPQKYAIFNAIRTWEEARRADAFPSYIRKMLQNPDLSWRLEKKTNNQGYLLHQMENGQKVRLFEL